MHRLQQFFAPGGRLAAVLPSYEPRQEQLDLATAVFQALERAEPLVAEAGTGTGKSLAYLVPAVLSGRRVIVSTATRALQEQIALRDLPLVATALDRPIAFQLMKGRTNYLCQVRAGRTLSQGQLPGMGQGLHRRIMEWAASTSTGDRAELTELPESDELWHELTATSDQCTGRACERYDTCFVMSMRREAQAAQLCIVNHHLYLADLALRQRLGDIALLPPHDVVIFDEAHELEETSSQHFGVSVSERRFTDLGRDLLPMLEGEVQRRAERLTGDIGRAARALFDTLPFSQSRTPLDTLPRSALAALAPLQDTLVQLENELGASSKPETASLSRRVAAVGFDLRFVLEGAPGISLVSATPDELAQPDPDPGPRTRFVRFTELHGRTRAVVARPIEVAGLLQDTLASRAAILVSATLSVKQSFEFVRQRLGVPETAAEILVDSPFDFAQQAGLYVADDLPEPDAKDFLELAADRAAELCEASGGGAFVLCTSYRALPVMQDAVQKRGLHVFLQGSAPKNHLLESFRQHGDAVLVATQSFWQGVDVPGRALRLVVIDKLPFAAPNDPLLAARLADLRARGIEPFRAYQLPHAALMLRQGFGRLIRHRDDRGLVAVLDRRLVSRSYARLLLDSLPKAPQLSLEGALALLRSADSPSESE